MLGIAWAESQSHTQCFLHPAIPCQPTTHPSHLQHYPSKSCTSNTSTCPVYDTPKPVTEALSNMLCKQDASGLQCYFVISLFQRFYLKKEKRKMESHYYTCGSKDNIPGKGPKSRKLCGCGQCQLALVLKSAPQLFTGLPVFMYRCQQLLPGWGCRSVLLVTQKVTWTWQGLAING